MMETSENKTNFIWDAVEEDLRSGRCQSVHTRFPPEPNGYLHIGHCKALVADFLTAEHFGGVTNLRFDDTNPAKEETEYVDGIMQDIHWLGFDWKGGLYFASEYYQKCYDIAMDWIQRGLAFVDELTQEQMREYRGTLVKPGKNSPYRDRPIEESVRLFEEMKAGKHKEGSMILRMKIDMASPNINMRDPAMYRILFKEHHRTGTEWCIYPMYDFAHPINDALEGITHSLCSLEFEDHRPLYDWVVSHVTLPAKPRQIEFARLDISYTVMSKRKLRSLVEEGLVDGWDDPRLPTLCGLRRRGYTPRAIRDFTERNGVSKVPSMVDIRFLEHCLREDLNERAPRAMAVLDPVKLTITNYPEGQEERFTVANLPGQEDAGTHDITFSRHLLIEREDFEEDPPKKYHRLYPGNHVRLRGAYIVHCTGCKKDEAGNVIEVLAEYDPETKGGTAREGQKVRGTIHWLDEETAIPAEVRLYDHLFTVEAPDEDEGDYHELLNPDSLQAIQAFVEPWLLDDRSLVGYQFMRLGYFIHDSQDNREDHLVFNRSVPLKDSYKP